MHGEMAGRTTNWKPAYPIARLPRGIEGRLSKELHCFHTSTCSLQMLLPLSLPPFPPSQRISGSFRDKAQRGWVGLSTGYTLLAA
jgi:hypothetical protein